jgi:predicted metal-dependent phosphoesterase TrpH
MTGPFALDLHVHTTAGSADASLKTAALGDAVRGVGLDGVLVTEHFRRWTDFEVESVADAQGIVIIPGREWTTTLGHVLALGMWAHQPELRDPSRLRAAADAEGGLLIAAHPFRHFFESAQQLHPGELRTDDPERAATLELFSYVDAIEIANGNCTPHENDFARMVAEVLNLPGTGGSDAHYADDLGRQRTYFPVPVRTVAELIEAIRSRALVVAPAHGVPI